MSDDAAYIKRGKRLDEHLANLKPKINQRYIRSFSNQAKLDRRTIATIVTNKEKLIIMFRKYINKDWKQITRKDMERAIAKINNNSEFSEKTKSNYKKIFKQFDKFMNGGEAYSKRTSWIKSSPMKRKLNGLKRSDLLDDTDKKKLIRACDNKRDMAIISLWLEAGLRPKTLRVLTVGCVSVEKDLAYITVPPDTKTGTRTIPIYTSKPYLVDYLNEHPGRNNDKAPLWYNKRRDKLVPLSASGFRTILRVIVERSGIQKRVYWYLGRHTSYTDKVADGWNEGILKEYHGIEPGSPVLNRYVHLSGRDVEKKVREYFGLDKGKKREPQITIKKCVNCQTDNPTTEKRCKKCGYIIDDLEMIKEIEKSKKKDQEIKKLQKQMSDLADKFKLIEKYTKLKGK